MPLQIKNGQTILFIGDSITDAGRRAQAAPLGDGYVKLFSDMVITREPQKRITIINKGIGGDRVMGLRQRWTDDVLRHKPDWLSVKIGINDLHTALFGQDTPWAPTGPITPDVFEKAYDEILSRAKEKLPKCRILLIDPFYISVDRTPNHPRRIVLDKLPGYIAVVHKMSRKYKTRLVKTHENFQKLLKTHNAEVFAPEPVHPNHTGHLAIAEWAYAALSR